MTFVNIAVAISALAGGGPKTISHRDEILAPSPNTGGVFVIFRFFLMSELENA